MSLSSNDLRLIEHAVELIREANRLTALTGAGISVPSGIPDFRSPSSGMWNKYDPSEVASIQAFRQNPIRFYEWLRPLIKTTKDAKPNAAHHAMTQMQQAGILPEIVTQNIDGLHEVSGSQNVLAVHGHTRTATCIRCRHQTDSEPLWEVVLAEQIPMCERCDNVYKPDVVLFGEALPRGIMKEAKRAAKQSDAMLVVGSSLTVHPVAGLPDYIVSNKGKLIIVNIGPTEYDHSATLKIEADVAEVLPRIVEGLV